MLQHPIKVAPNMGLHHSIIYEISCWPLLEEELKPQKFVQNSNIILDISALPLPYQEVVLLYHTIKNSASSYHNIGNFSLVNQLKANGRRIKSTYISYTILAIVALYNLLMSYQSGAQHVVSLSYYYIKNFFLLADFKKLSNDGPELQKIHKTT